MSEIILMGLNHKTAPVQLREALAFTEEEAFTALTEIKKQNKIKEVLIFSTCNRMEILFVSHECLPADAVNSIKDFISEFKKIPISQFDDSFYTYFVDDAVKHIFRVASSLDSMIVGEPQILGQVKKAFRTSVTGKSSGVILNRLMHKSFNIAKRVRRETGIGDHAVSISYAAIELANKIFSDLGTKSVMLLGAGEMAELAVEYLITNGVKNISIANRTFCNAVTLAEKFNGNPIKFEERQAMLEEVDIIISSTGATQCILNADEVKKAMRKRKNRPLFFIDIAVPRDIDPDINKISNAYLYDIDDLNNIVNDNMEERQMEAVKGERLVEEAVVKFRRWLENLKLVPTIVDIKEKINSITEAETRKTLGHLKNLSADDVAAIERMTQSIAKKLMHDPILFLKNIGDHRDNSLYLSLTRQLFNLNNINCNEANPDLPGLSQSKK